VDAVLPGTEYALVQLFKVELALCGLNHFPRNTSQYRIDVSINHFGPHCIHVLAAGHGRVLQLGRQHKVGLAIDNKLLAILCVNEVRKF
jgi:hypothetical protein